jgi:hypothetical protein
MGTDAHLDQRVNARSTRSAAKEDVQARQREWLQHIVKATDDKPSVIATRSGVSDSTLTRLLNNPAYRHTLTQVTIDRIKAAYNVPGPEEYAVGRPGMLVGFGEAERVDVRREPKELQSVVGALIGDRKAIEIWRLRTDALIVAGYLPGDLVLVDPAAEAKPQDLVSARVADWQRGNEQTLFRIFDPPFLVAASQDRTAFKPLLVDPERVQLRGVVIESYRPHRLSATR